MNSESQDEVGAVDAPTEAVRVEAVLATSAGHVERGVATEIGPAGVVVEFGGGSAPALALGEDAWMCLSGPPFPSGLECAVRAVRREESRDCCKFVLEPTHAGDLRHAPLFKRRGGARLPPRADAPVELQLSTPAGECLTRGLVSEISRSGLSTQFEAADERRTAGHFSVVASLLLPGEAEPLRIAALIRGRTLNGTLVRCGLQFERENTPEFEALDRRIGRYVMSRQVELVLERKREEQAQQRQAS